MSTVQPVAFPRGPMQQPDGTLSHTWQRFFLDLYRKTGQASNHAPINSSNIDGILASLHLNNNGQLNTTNYCTVDSVDNGTNATIRVYGTGGPGSTWQRQVSNVMLGPYPALSQAGLSYATNYYVVYDPVNSVFIVSANFADILNDNYIWCGYPKTVNAGGSGGSSGGGGGSGGSGGVCFSGNTKVMTPDGPKQFYTLPTYPVLITKQGPKTAKLVISPYEGYLHHMGNDEWVTPSHPIERDGHWVAAQELYPERKTFSGHVYNAHILTDKEEERNYLLENGETVHNLSML